MEEARLLVGEQESPSLEGEKASNSAGNSNPQLARDICPHPDPPQGQAEASRLADEETAAVSLSRPHRVPAPRGS